MLIQFQFIRFGYFGNYADLAIHVKMTIHICHCAITYVIRVTFMSTAMVRLSSLFFIGHRSPRLRVHRQRSTLDRARMNVHMHDITNIFFCKIRKHYKKMPR